MRKCLQCKQPYTGRHGKVFCSLKCKNNYHVLLRRKTNLAAKQIDRILHRNRSILFEVMGSNLTKKKVSRKILDKKKFNYKYFTHQHTNSRGKTIRYLYDFGWVEFTDQEVLVVGSKY